MKKNLRIVSAAAAALLAVAPVAATSVSTVFADTNVTVVGGSTNDGVTTATLSLDVNNALTLVNGDSATKLNVTLATPTLPAGATVTASSAKVYTSAVAGTVNSDGALTGTATPTNNLNTLATDTDYVAVTYVNITGLKANTAYTINGVTKNSGETGVISNFPVVSSTFRLANTALTGAPYLVETGKNTAVNSGSVNLTSNQFNVAGVVAAIQAHYSVANTTTGTGSAEAAFKNLESDVRTALKNAGITVKADNSFDKPAATFPVTVNMQSTNGVTNTAIISVNPNPTVDDSYPLISYNGTGYTGTHTINLADDASFNYVKVNDSINKTALEGAFTALVSNHTGATPITPTFDYSKVDTKVAGRYPVTVSVTNAEKKTTKVTFYLTVGSKGATYKTVQADGDIPIYKIEGNTVTDTKSTIKNGSQIAIFGDPVKVGDKSYSRINTAESNEFVETKYIDGSFKPAEKTSKTVMHNAYIYDKDHKRVGTKTLAAYTKVDVLGATTKLADGSLVYQIGDNQYVMADNIDGTVRTLSHNAYVYKTSKKRADSRVLRKGAKVTTYGSPYTFKNGKAYYRIGGPSKQYVKVANFN